MHSENPQPDLQSVSVAPQGFAGRYASASLVLSIVGCWPVTLLLTSRHTNTFESGRGMATVFLLPYIAGGTALLCALGYVRLRELPHWHRRVLWVMWLLSGLSLVVWMA